ALPPAGEHLRRPVWRRHAAILVAATVLTGASWMSIIPPFEGTDELFFYNRARVYASSPERREPFFYRLVAPAIRTISPDAGLVEPDYNPAFHYVSNARGEVNRFVHNRRVAPRAHVRTLMAMRAVVVVVAVATVLAIYAMARLTLDDGWAA